MPVSLMGKTGETGERRSLFDANGMNILGAHWHRFALVDLYSVLLEFFKLAVAYMLGHFVEPSWTDSAE